MKPRDVYKRLSLDPKTLITWVDRLPEFFSEGARGVKPGSLSRDYSEDDLIVINTVLRMRAEKKEFKEIEEALSAGYRDRDLPPAVYELDAEKAVTVYADMREMKAVLEAAESEIERLRSELTAERVSSQQEIIALNRKIAVLEYQLEQLRGKSDGE